MNLTEECLESEGSPICSDTAIQQKMLQAASWKSIQIWCHTALPDFHTITRKKISFDRIPIFWFTLSFGDFWSGCSYYSHKRNKETISAIQMISVTGDGREKWRRHILKRFHYAMSCSLQWHKDILIFSLAISVASHPLSQRVIVM
jgi:hypothetical protein